MQNNNVKNGHIIFIGNSYNRESGQNNYSDYRKEFEIDNEHYTNNLIENIKVYFPEGELIILNFDDFQFEHNYQIQNQFKSQIHEILLDFGNILFNVNESNLKVTPFIKDLAHKNNSKVYLITESEELVYLPTDNDKKYDLDEDITKEILKLENFMLESLEFKDLNKNGQIKYDFNEKIIGSTLLCSKEIIDDNIVIKNSDPMCLECESLKLLKIKGFKLSNQVRPNSKDIFLRKVFEGLSSYRFRIVKLLLNDKHGINYYLGIIERGTSLEITFEKLNYNIEQLQNLIRAIFPGIEIELVKATELENITRFIQSQSHIGSIVGHTSNNVSNSIFRELENAIAHEKWALMTISENLHEDSIETIINDLKSEVESITPYDSKINDEIEFIELVQSLKSRRDSIENKYKGKVQNILDFFQKNQDYGLWNTCNYVMTNKKIIYDTVNSIVKANYQSINHFWFPVKIIEIDNFLSQFAKNFQLIDVKRNVVNISNEFKLFNTIYSSQQLGDYIHFPSKSLINFAISYVPTFATEFPLSTINSMSKAINIGTIKNSSSKNNKFYINLDDLTRHCLIMGSTGSGKTNTIINLLLNIKNEEFNIPFLIIEPIKTEFRHLLNYIDDLEIYTAGANVNPLKINLFEVPPFLSYSQWVNELLEIICISFYIWEPFRGVILNCLNEIYQINGWTEDVRGRTPVLDDFIKFAKLKIECSSYNLRVRQNHMGAFENRFDSLIQGSRGLTFNVGSSHPTFEDLLKKPIILELNSIRNNDERALIFNFIIKKLFLYQQHFGHSNSLRHLTVIEEAHRLIAKSFNSSDAQERSISAKAQKSFSEILAEIREYGEGIIISEQKPRQLNNVAISNTNQKIAHKLPSRAQIEDFKDSLGLESNHLPVIARLKPGECIVNHEELDNPFLVQINLVKNKSWGNENKITDDVIKSRLSIQPKLVQIHYSISQIQQNSDFLLTITELSYQENNTEKKYKFPKKETCLKFPDFKYMFWNRMKEFFTNYSFCNSCQKVILISESQNKCPKCKSNLEKIKKLKVEQFGFSLNSEIILKNIKIDELYNRKQKLIPSEYDREYQTAHAALKQDFDSILNLTIKENSNVEIVKTMNLKSKFFSLRDSLDQKKDTTILRGEHQKSIIKCEKCKDHRFRIHKIVLDLVRKSPRKLVFTISTFIVNCLNCGQKRAIFNPTTSISNLLPNLSENLKKELKYHITQNLYCPQCNEYYENLKSCPKHPSIPLTPPKLVFIRGINQQYSTSRLL